MIERPDYIPADYGRIRLVKSRRALLTTPFNKNTDVILYPRSILSPEFNALAKAGAFEEVAKLAGKSLYPRFTTPMLQEFINAVMSSKQPEKVKNALDLIVGDMTASCRAKPGGIRPFKEIFRIIGTKGYGNETDDYHADGVTNFGRIMCVYTPFVTQWLRKQDAIHTGYNDDGTPAYRPAGKAKPFSFGIGDMWRHSDQFVHCARPSPSDDIPSLRLVI